MDILEACGASDLGSNPSSGVVLRRNGRVWSETVMEVGVVAAATDLVPNVGKLANRL